MWHNWQSFLRVRGTKFGEVGSTSQLHQTSRDHRAIIAAFHFCFRVRISCCISKAGGSNLSDAENDAKVCTFWPLWKLGKGWGTSLYQLLKLYLRPNLRNTIHLMAIHWAAAERGVLIKNKEKKKERKESSWVKLKAFQTNVGRPNKTIAAIGKVT